MECSPPLSQVHGMHSHSTGKQNAHGILSCLGGTTNCVEEGDQCRRLLQKTLVASQAFGGCFMIRRAQKHPEAAIQVVHAGPKLWRNSLSRLEALAYTSSETREAADPFWRGSRKPKHKAPQETGKSWGVREDGSTKKEEHQKLLVASQ